MNIAIAGVGKHSEVIENLINRDENISFYIDNSPQKIGKCIKGRRVYSPFDFPADEIEMIVVAPFSYEIIRKQLISTGFSTNRILCFFDKNNDFSLFGDLFNVLGCIQYSFRCQLDYIKGTCEQKIDYIYQNLLFEDAAYRINRDIRLPKILSVKDTVDIIINERKSISRYGDGEFQIILGKPMGSFQENDDFLASRLKEILVSNLDGHIVALADDYGNMEDFSERAKDVIRRYMTREKREEHYRFIDLDKVYYNAYMSRPYIIYPWDDISAAYERFRHLKCIWNEERVVIIEGDKTRFGVGNDLLKNALNVNRVLCPNENAFRVYNRIIDAVKRIDKSHLLLISLGPTATVLAYDLAKLGYWAVDVGHLDLEYEWFLKGEGFSYIRSKYDNELPGDTFVEDIHDKDYEDSILERIEV